MLRKLLPTLFKRKQSEKQNQHEPEKEPVPQRNPSPNLLSSVETKNVLSKVESKLVIVTNIVVFLVASLFFIFLAINFTQDISLNKLKAQRDDYILSIDIFLAKETDTKNISKRLETYRAKKASITKSNPSLSFLLEKFKDRAILTDLSYSSEEKAFDVTLRAEGASIYANLINDILVSPSVDFITIKEVKLLGKSKLYEANLTIKIK